MLWFGSRGRVHRRWHSLGVSALAVLAVGFAVLPATPGFAAQAVPTAPKAWNYVPYQVDPQQEAALSAALSGLASSDEEVQRATEALDLVKASQPAAYRLLIRATTLPSGDPAGRASGLWRMLMAPDGGIPVVSLFYHEYTHLAQTLGTPAGLSANNVFVNQPVILRLYPMDGYWVGAPEQRELMPVREVFGDVPDPQPARPRPRERMLVASLLEFFSR